MQVYLVNYRPSSFTTALKIMEALRRDRRDKEAGNSQHRFSESKSFYDDVICSGDKEREVDMAYLHFSNTLKMSEFLCDLKVGHLSS